MNANGSRCFLWLQRIWRDEACASPVEGAVLACAMAGAAMLAAAGLKSEWQAIFALIAHLANSFLP